jgi:hypothetical protein
VVAGELAGLAGVDEAGQGVQQNRAGASAGCQIDKSVGAVAVADIEVTGVEHPTILAPGLPARRGVRPQRSRGSSRCCSDSCLWQRSSWLTWRRRSASEA